MSVNGKLVLQFAIAQNLYLFSWVRTKPCARSNSGVTVSPAGKAFRSSQIDHGEQFCQTGCESRAWECGDATASVRLQIRGGENSRDATFGPCCRCRKFCRAWSRYRGQHALCACANRARGAQRFQIEPVARFLLRLCWRSDSIFFSRFFSAMNLVHHFHEVPHFMDHAAGFRRVLRARPPDADGASRAREWSDAYHRCS